MSDKLIEFLKARLAEDEQTAARLRSELWWIGNVTLIKAYAGRSGDRILFQDPLVDGRKVPVTEAIQRALLVGSPEVLQRRVDAYGRIVSAYEEAVAAFNDSGPALASYDRLTGSVSSLLRAIELLALPYADHPDYREEWTP